MDISEGEPTAPRTPSMCPLTIRTGAQAGVCLGKARNSQLNFPPIFNIPLISEGGGRGSARTLK